LDDALWEEELSVEERRSCNLSLVNALFGVWSEGVHRDWNEINSWAESIHPLIVG